MRSANVGMHGSPETLIMSRIMAMGWCGGMSPDQGGVYRLVRMPPGPGPRQPLLWVTDGGVDPSVEHHLHPSVGLV